MKTIAIFLLTLICFIFSGCQIFSNQKSFLFQENNQVNQKINNQEPVREEMANRLLDGVLVNKNQEKNIPVVIMLENLPGVPRPPISYASLIYEIPVEGGFTRFLAIFDKENLPEKIGPIRSVRPYFAEIAEEYRPILIHAGGSNEVIFRLKQGFYKVFNLDEIGWQGKYFFRSQSSMAPHNLYIKKDQVLTFLEDNKIENLAKFSPWQFKEEDSGEGEVKNIKISFSSIYNVSWNYDQEKKEYVYSQAEKKYFDQKNQELKVKNLMVEITKIDIIDNVGRRKIKTNGSNKAIIFQNGKVIKGKWFKEAGRTKFYDENGQEIILLSGKTWIGVVSQKEAVNY